jgi:polar amino acid transport system substrate-binding protein
MISRLTNLCVPLLFALLGCAASAQTIRGVTEETSYSFLRDGRVAGPASEIVEATLQRAGLDDYRLAIYPWARAYDIAQQEPNVLIYLIARTPERESLFKWVGEITRIDYHFYKLRDQQDVVVPDLAAAKNYSVGVLRDDVRHQYLLAEGFTRLVVSAQNSDNFRKLLNRQVQLVPMPERDVAMLSAEAGIDFSQLEAVYTLPALSTGLYMAYSRWTADEIVARTRTAFQSVKAEGLVTRALENRR